MMEEDDVGHCPVAAATATQSHGGCTGIKTEYHEEEDCRQLSSGVSVSLSSGKYESGTAGGEGEDYEEVNNLLTSPVFDQPPVQFSTSQVLPLSLPSSDDVGVVVVEGNTCPLCGQSQQQKLHLQKLRQHEKQHQQQQQEQQNWREQCNITSGINDSYGGDGHPHDRLLKQLQAELLDALMKKEEILIENGILRERLQAADDKVMGLTKNQRLARRKKEKCISEMKEVSAYGARKKAISSCKKNKVSKPTSRKKQDSSRKTKEVLAPRARKKKEKAICKKTVAASKKMVSGNKGKLEAVSVRKARSGKADNPKDEASTSHELNISVPTVVEGDHVVNVPSTKAEFANTDDHDIGDRKDTPEDGHSVQDASVVGPTMDDSDNDNGNVEEADTVVLDDVKDEDYKPSTTNESRSSGARNNNNRDYDNDNNFISRRSKGENNDDRARKQFVCPVCSFVCPTNYRLKRHMGTHLKVKPYKCLNCSKTFGRRRDMEDHSYTHGGDRPYKCTFCDKAFVRKSQLQEHSYIHEEGGKPYKCTICDKAYLRRIQLVEHSRQHSGERPHVCDICGKRFAMVSSYYTHLKIHTGRKRFQCSVCNKNFFQSGNLTVHMRVHTGYAPFQCSVCNKAFKQQGDLAQHNRVHTGEKPHQCPTCGKTFSSSTYLNRHIRAHSTVKTFQCPLCPKAFKEGNYLTRHMTIHSGERPHPCPVCGQTFRLQYNLEEHIRRHNVRGARLNSRTIAPFADTSFASSKI